MIDKTQLPQPTASVQPIPSRYPSMPDDVLRRFPSFEKYQQDVDAYFRKLRSALYDMTDAIGSAANKALVASRGPSSVTEARYNDLLARITVESEARVSGDTALASTIASIVAAAGTSNTVFVQSSAPTANSVNDIWLDSDDGFKPYYWSGTAWTDATDGRITANIAAITTEATARASADGALASSLTALIATVNGNTSSIATITSTYATQTYADTKKAEAIAASTTYTNGQISGLSSVYATPTYVTASINTAIASEVTNRNSAITASASALTTAYTAADAALNSSLSSSISSLTATVTSNNTTLTASINSEATARAAADGHLSSKYTLRVAAGNVVTGMNFTSATDGGTDISEVTFQAGVFKIYNGSTGVAPFQVSGGQVRVLNLAIASTDVSGLAATATSSDYGSITGTKPPANADVTLTAISGLLNISSGGLVLSGTSLIKSSNYAAGTAGWAIKPDGSVDFSSGTFRGNIDIGSGNNRVQIQSGQIALGVAGIGSSGTTTPTTAIYAVSGSSSMEMRGYSTVDPVTLRGLSTVTGQTFVLAADSGNFFTSGVIKTGSYIAKMTPDGWTPALDDGDNRISFKWDGQFKVKIDATEFVIF